ncbi:MAG: HAD-IA family hydrolase [Magnetococcus sp. XQGC-1]
MFLDIGFTLLGGPPDGPARRIQTMLNLSLGTKQRLSEILFRESFADGKALGERISREFSVDLDRSRLVCQDLWSRQVAESFVLPGARETMVALQCAGFRLGLISNIWKPFFEGFQRHFPEESANFPRFLSYEMGVAKPDGQIYRLALEQTGTDPRNGVMVGDTYDMDVKTPQRIGMKTVWLLHRPEKEKESLLKILNGEEKAADLTLPDIGSLRAEHLSRLLC